MTKGEVGVRLTMIINRIPPAPCHFLFIPTIHRFFSSYPHLCPQISAGLSTFHPQNVHNLYHLKESRYKNRSEEEINGMVRQKSEASREKKWRLFVRTQILMRVSRCIVPLLK